MQLAGWPLGLGHNHHPHTRGQDPSDGWEESFYAFPAHKGALRQHQPRHLLRHAKGQKSQPVPCVLDQVFPVWQDVPAPLSRVAQGVRPRVGWNPSGVSHLSATVRHIRVPPPLWHSTQPMSLLHRRLRSDSVLHVVPTEHPDPAETVRRVKGQRGPAWCQFLHPQDRAHPLAYEQGQRPDLQRSDSPRWVGLHAHERGPMARLLVHPLALHHPPLRQETSQGSSGLRGRQETLPSWDGHLHLPVPSLGLLPPLLHPQLQHGYHHPHSPHDSETLGLLAYGPEVDHQLLQVHPHRHLSRRGLPPRARAPTRIQALPGEPPDTLLPPRNQPSSSTATPLRTDAIAAPPHPGP